MKFAVLFISVIFLANIAFSFAENQKEGSRQKRSVILLPSNTSITLTFDLSMPVTPLATQLAFYNMRVPFRFFIPTYNQLTAFYGRNDENENELHYRHEQERANEERRYIYKNIESLLTSFGIDGLSCLQRAICELAEAPISHNDLLGNTLSLLFTPPRIADFSRWITGHNGVDNDMKKDKCETCQAIDEEMYEDEYVSAFRNGKKGICQTEYGTSCPISFFTRFSI